MEVYKLKWTVLGQEIFALLCLRAGEKLSQRDIAGIVKASPTAVANSLAEIKKDNLITFEKTKTINFISLNRNERRALELKRVENLRNVYTSGLLGILENELPGATIFLFGSYSRGEDTNTSDIDLAVIGRKEKIIGLSGYEKSLNRKINISYYASWKKIGEYLKNNILNGIILHGGVEL